MKTTIDIPDDLLKKVMKHTRAKTKRQAVIDALQSFDQREMQREAIKLLGTFKTFMTQEQLREMRTAREKRHDDRRQQLLGGSVARTRRSRNEGARRKTA